MTKVLRADPSLYQESANPSQGILSWNTEITGVAEIVDFISFYGIVCG